MSRNHNNNTHIGHGGNNRRYAYSISDGYYVADEEEVMGGVSTLELQYKESIMNYHMMTVMSLVMTTISISVTIVVSYQLYTMNKKNAEGTAVTAK